MRKIISGSRYLIIIAVIGSYISALALLIYGGIDVIRILLKFMGIIKLNVDVDKEIIVAFIDVIDLFLMGIVFYIISLGLYELFIDENIKTPNWLIIRDFDSLKGKLVSVVIVVLGVLFLGKAVGEKDSLDLLYFGGGIALVITALAYFLRRHENHQETSDAIDH
jgi:uncharacterized membrane protein YqhA